MKNKKAFVNGKIYTVNRAAPIVEAVIIEGNRITFAGKNSEAKSLIDNQTEVIDLNKKLMLPGLIDNHVHFIDGGFYLNGLNLRGARSIDEFKERIAGYVSLHKDGWVTGGCWNNEDWDINCLPTRETIDGITSGVPVFIERMDKHMALANSLALKIAEITKDTPSPEDGEIVKDKITGEPTGLLKDNAMKLVYSVMPEHDVKDFCSALVSALNEAKKYGLTSVHDISMPEHIPVYKEFLETGRLTCRIYSRLPINNYKNILKEINPNDFKNEFLKFGSLKAFADGSLGSGTAWFFDNYEGENNNFGLPMEIITNGSFERMAAEADKNGLQLSVHAIGDRANSALLDIFEKINKINLFRDRRFRIEHAQHVRKSDIKRFNKLGVISSAQPYHLYYDGSWAERKIGNRINEAYQFKSFLEENVKICFGSDWPVVSLNPLLGIYAAVTRQTSSRKNPGGWVPEQKISVTEAVKCYTIAGAYASFDENIKGSIEPGKIADFTVLDKDIFTIPTEDIKNVSVVMTVLGGEIIFP